MDMLGVVAIDAGLLCVLVGLISVCKPLKPIGIRTRRTGLVVILIGVVAIATGINLPVREMRLGVLRTRLDEFVPLYQFYEWHTTTVNAPPERVYAAIQEVEADEILAFRTLTWLRRFGRAGKPSILN